MKDNKNLDSQLRFPYEPVAIKVTGIIPGRVLCASTPQEKSVGLSAYEEEVNLSL